MTKPTYVVGYEFTNKQGFKAVVIAYRGRKDIDVQFEDGAIVERTTGSYIAKGFPLHPTFGKVLVGDRFPCKCGDTVEVVEVVSSSKIRAKWLSDGAEKWTSADTLRLGVNRHPNNWRLSEGQQFQTNNHGTVTVVEFNSATDVVVKFEDGELKKTTSNALHKGVVRPDGFFKSRVGYKFVTNSGWSGEVVEYHNVHDVIVRWQDGSESSECWSDIAAKAIKPLFQPSVSGVGFVGQGRFVPKSYKLAGDKEYADARIFAYWQRMITRCYNEKEQSKPSGRAYIGCSVREDWHNFQNFAEWAYKKPQAWFMEGDKIWELDKDSLVEGNKVYRADRCTFLPPELNTFFSDSTWSKDCPRGVNYIKPASTNSKEGWIARCNMNGERKYLGYFNDPMTAFYKYKDVKESYAEVLAEKYKGRIEDDVYLRLRNFKVHPYPPTQDSEVKP